MTCALRGLRSRASPSSLCGAANILSIVFSRSTDAENDPIALYFAARGPRGYDAGTLLPPSVNVDGGYTLGPSVDGKDRSVLYFSGKRPEASAGKLDVYRVHYAVGAAR